MSYNVTLSCPFSRHIVNIGKSEYPETIAKYGKKKTEKLANFPVMLSVLIMVSVITGQSGMNSFTNARYAIRVLYKFLLHLPCQLESWRKTSTQAPTCSLLRQKKKSKNPLAKRKREVGLKVSHKNYINWRRLEPDLFDPHLRHIQHVF